MIPHYFVVPCENCGWQPAVEEIDRGDGIREPWCLDCLEDRTTKGGDVKSSSIEA